MICKQTTNHEVFNFLLGLFEENAGVTNWAFVFLFFFSTFCQKSESRPRANGVRPDHPGYYLCVSMRRCTHCDVLCEGHRSMAAINPAMDVKTEENLD